MRVLAVGLILLLTTAGWSQDRTEGSSLTAQAAAAVAATNGATFFHTVGLDRRLWEARLGYSRTLHHWTHLKLSYHGEIIPVMVINDPGVRTTITDRRTGATIAIRESRTLASIEHLRDLPDVPVPKGAIVTAMGFRSSAYGGGVSPFGLELHARPDHRLQPFLAATAGFLLFTRDEPIEHAAAFNFSFTWGAGLELRTAGRSSYLLSYRLLHMSNAGTGSLNPGVNTHTIAIAYRFGLGR